MTVRVMCGFTGCRRPALFICRTENPADGTASLCAEHRNGFMAGAAEHGITPSSTPAYDQLERNSS